MTLRISPEAAEDLRNIEEYIARDNPIAAAEFIDHLTEQFETIENMPGIGRRRDEIRPGYRTVAVVDYLIFYRQVGDTVEVMHVVHGRRDLPRFFADQ